MAEEPLKLVQNNKTDKEIAEDLRLKVQKALEPLLEIITLAARDDFMIAFNIGLDGTKRACVQSITINKQF